MKTPRILGQLVNKSDSFVRYHQPKTPGQISTIQRAHFNSVNSRPKLQQLQLESLDDFLEQNSAFKLPDSPSNVFSLQSNNFRTPGSSYRSHKQRFSSICMEGAVPCTQFQFFSPKKQSLQGKIEASTNDLRVLIDIAGDLCNQVSKIEAELKTLLNGGTFVL